MQSSTWDWLSSSALTRLAPGAPVIMIGTLWTPQDPILKLIESEGLIREGGKWTVVHLPAIADSSLTGEDPLGRADGDPLTHPLIPDQDTTAQLAHWHDKRSSVLPLDWQALYQGDPHPRSGALISWDDLPLVPPAQIPPAGRTVVAVDPSGGGNDEVGIITAHLGPDSVTYLTADHSEIMPVTAWPERVCQVADDAGADRIVMEVNFGGRMVDRVIRSAWESHPRENLMPALTYVRALRGKILRAEPVAQQMIQGRVKISSGLDKLCRQWASYRAGSPDSPGRLDACVFACVELLRLSTPGLMTRSTPRRRDAVRSTGPRLPGR